MVNVANQFGSVVKTWRNPLQLLLSVLILINYAPTQILGTQLNNHLQSAIRMTHIHEIMKHTFVRLFLWLVLLWSCCWGKDTSLFLLVTVYFVVSGR